jgi:hypothetical protein
MGFDIDICPVRRVKGKIEVGESVDETYISYNFSKYSSICEKHYFTGKCPEGEACDLKYIWYFRKDCHGRRGDDIAARAEKGLTTLKSMGINVGIPDMNKNSWGWATNCSRKESLEVFAYHINRFLELGQKYPKYFFFGDGGSDCYEEDIVYPDDYTSDDDNDNDSDSDGEEIEHMPVTYFRHPFKGTICVKTFKDAMEVYGLCRAIDDPMADEWYDLAFKMSDAPKTH